MFLSLCNYATVGPIIIFRNGQFRYLWMIDAVVRQLSQLADANSPVIIAFRNDSSFVNRLCCVTDTDDTTRVTYRHAIVSSPPLSLSYDIIDPRIDKLII